MKGSLERLSAVSKREFWTLTRTPVYVLVAVAFAATVMALALVGGVAGYVPVILNLLTPLELLLPVLAAAFGYRSVLADRESGEVDILRTFPVSRSTYVGGILVGRLTVLLTIVLTTLFLLGVAVPFLTPESSQFLRRQTSYSAPLLFVRFCVITALGTVVLFTIMMALSAISRESRRGLALVILAGVALAVGFDLAIIAGFATDLFSEALLPWLLALSPLSAFRTLVLGTVVEPAIDTPLRAGSVTASLLALSLWFLTALAATVYIVWSPVEK